MNATPEQQLHRAIRLLAAAAFASSVSARLCDPMLPELARIFAASPAAVAHVVSGFAVAYGVLQAGFGPLGDRLGKYRLIALTTLLCTIGSFAAAVAASLNGLIAARVLTGAAAAGIIPLAMAWIGDNVAYEERQATLARFIAGQVAGVIGGQFVGGVFTDTVGWRWAFACVCLLYLAVGIRLLRESQRNSLTRPTSVVAPGHAGLVAQALALFAVPWARLILLVVFVEGMIVFGGMAFIPLYLHQRYSLAMSSAGALLGMFGLGGLAYIFFARRLVRRLGERGLVLCGGLLISLAWSLLALGAAWGWTIPACALLGLGYYMVHNTLQTHATQMAPATRGTAVALFSFCLFVGQAIGVSVAGYAFDHLGYAPLLLAPALTLPLVGWGFARALKRRRPA